MAHVDLLGAIAGRTADGGEFRVRSPWYRSLPLSCVDVELSLDGIAIESERITFGVNGQSYSLRELRELIDEFWFVLDPARLRVRKVEPGSHDVFLRLGLRVPYLFDEETGEVLQHWSEAQRRLTVPAEAAA